MPWYVDTSAFVKLIVEEPGSTAMAAWADHQVATGVGLWSSDLLHTEAIRAARRASPAATQTVVRKLALVNLVAITGETFRRAALLEPTTLRSLDALHLAAALRLQDDLTGIVTYDQRLADAAAALGIATLSP